MEYTHYTLEDKDGEEGGKGDMFFIEDCNSSEGEEEMFSDQRHHSSCKQATALSREGSPPLILAFSMTSGRPPQPSSPTPSLDSQEEEEDSGQPIEEWMILGGEEQVGDSSIQLNLSYFNSSEDDSGEEDHAVESVKDTWAVSEKDKPSADQSSRYFTAVRSPSCNLCNRTGHSAKRCYYHKRKPTCVLCGMPGHTQRHCPSRPCHSCGLPSHGPRPCERPPVWNQHCQRCGMSGHLSDICPDTWRQYHLTNQLELPVRPWTVHNHKQKKFPAHCYNCSKRGHHGYACTKRRMISGTFPSLPYVCHYDTIDDILQCCTGKQKGVKGLSGAGSHPLSDQQLLSEATGESGEENRLVQGGSRTKQETCSQAGRRKKWPERRRERWEVKRLRRDAQARRGGLLERSQRNFNHEVCPAEPLRSALHIQKQPSTLPLKKRNNEAAGRSRKSREAERWKKRRGIKHRDLHPHGNNGRNSISPKHRVRHRRR